MNERIKTSLGYIKIAREHLINKEMDKALKAFSDAFYLRCTTKDFIDLQFHLFFYYQFNKYLSNKKQITISLPEGDMVADLIKDAYDNFLSEIENSPFNIGQTETIKLMKTLKLVFPGHIDSEMMA